MCSIESLQFVTVQKVHSAVEMMAKKKDFWFNDDFDMIKYLLFLT